MPYYFLFASVVILCSCVTNVTFADNDRDNEKDRHDQVEAFVGLWQAIDSFDGSTQRLSVTCSNRKKCDVRLNDTAFTDACQDQIMGFAQGKGRIKNGVLSVKLTLTCSNSMTLEQQNFFVLNPKNGTLRNDNSDDLEFPNVFHRISK